MATFTDTFDRTDQLLDAVNAWQVIDDNNGQVGIENFSNYATNAAGLVESRAYQNVTIATTSTQKVEAYVTSFLENANARIEIGVGGLLDAAWASTKKGVYLRLEYLPSGKRVLSLRTDNRGTDEQVTALTLVDTGTVVKTGYHGKILNNGALATIQHIRLIVLAETHGLTLKAFINNDDDDRPTIETRLPSDWITHDTGNPFAAWWFGFGPLGTGGNSRKLAVTWFSAQDYTQPDRVDISQNKDQLTFRELIDLVKTRYTGSVNSNLPEELIKQFINDEVEQAINFVGDQAWFLIRNRTFTLSLDSEGLMTLSSDVARLMDLTPVNIPLRNVDWQFFGMDANGNIILRIDNNRETTGQSYRMLFLSRFQRMGADTDVCPIPRKHTELVVVGAMRRFAEKDRSPALQRSFDGRYQELLRLFMSDMARHGRQTRQKMEPRRRGRAPVVFERRWWGI